MALPTFSHASMTTLTFSKGNIFPSDDSVREPNQIVKFTESGQVKVATLSQRILFLPVVFVRLPQADIDNLIAWFEDANINWAESAFTWTDAFSTAYSVRLVSRSLRIIRSAPALFNVDMMLRVEVP